MQIGQVLDDPNSTSSEDECARVHLFRQLDRLGVDRFDRVTVADLDSWICKSFTPRDQFATRTMEIIQFSFELPFNFPIPETFPDYRSRKNVSQDSRYESRSSR